MNHRPQISRSLLCVLAAVSTACAPLTPRSHIPPALVASPNFDERRPNLVVIHHTGNDSLDLAIETLTSPERRVSAHYVIGRDGQTLQLVDAKHRAWHAGKSWWSGMADINSMSIGIELDNTGEEPFADAQIDALLVLLADLRARYHIHPANVVGHADIAPTRKEDPSALFPWKRLAEHGFGLWCPAPSPPAPAGFDRALALAALGYDPAAPDAAWRAFRRHYTGNEAPGSDDEEDALLYCLLKKKYFGQTDTAP